MSIARPSSTALPVHGLPAAATSLGEPAPGRDSPTAIMVPAPGRDSPTAIMVPVPVSLPAGEELRAIVFAAARAAAEGLLGWLTYEEAAGHLRCSKRSIERLPGSHGLPVSELGGMRLIARCDLDALVTAHLTAPAGSVLVVWPSTVAVPKEGRVVAWPSRNLLTELRAVSSAAERRAA